MSGTAASTLDRPSSGSAERDGAWVWLEAFVKLTRSEATGEPDGYVASVRDISRRKEAESRLAHIAAHDPLTGLPNRTRLHERLTLEISRTARTRAGFAVLCLDLDRFKRVNDEFGHEAGDTVLRVVAGRLQSMVRAEDTVARLGGDEFVMIQTTAVDVPASAMRLADRLIAAVSQPIPFNGTPLNVGLSVGIAIAPIPGADADGLLRAADEALYEAKEAGRNKYRMFGHRPAVWD
jgi:diguanylate cyclase (GGDEF)-like protein